MLPVLALLVVAALLVPAPVVLLVRLQLLVVRDVVVRAQLLFLVLLVPRLLLAQAPREAAVVAVAKEAHLLTRSF